MSLIFLRLIAMIFTTNIKIIIITKKSLLSSSKTFFFCWYLQIGIGALRDRIHIIASFFFFWFPVKQFLDVWAMEFCMCTFLCVLTTVLSVVIAYCKNNKTTRRETINYTERWLLDITPKCHSEDQKFPADVTSVIRRFAG